MSQATVTARSLGQYIKSIRSQYSNGGGDNSGVNSGVSVQKIRNLKQQSATRVTQLCVVPSPTVAGPYDLLGRPGLFVLTSLMVFVDVKQY